MVNYLDAICKVKTACVVVDELQVGIVLLANEKFLTKFGEDFEIVKRVPRRLYLEKRDGKHNKKITFTTLRTIYHGGENTESYVHKVNEIAKELKADLVVIRKSSLHCPARTVFCKLIDTLPKEHHHQLSKFL